MKNADKPAYTLPNPELTEAPDFQGLTKRERFAMAAMQGYCSNTDLSELDTEEIAFFAVNQADALLKELDQRKGEA